MKLKVLRDSEAVALTAGAVVAAAAREAVAARGGFIVAASGGKTPWLMLRRPGR